MGGRTQDDLMKRTVISTTLIVSLVSFAAVAAKAQDARSAQSQQSETRDTSQNARTSATDKLEDASAKMLQLGLTTPSPDAQYKQVSVMVGSVWGGQAAVQTHGWVMPSGDVICWDGQSYKPQAVGDDADLSKDVEENIAHLEKARAKKQASDMRISSTTWDDPARTQSEAVDFKTTGSIPVAMLVLIGKPDLANRLWLELKARMQTDDTGAIEPYNAFADEWIWSLFDRAICAHINGDDPTSLACAERCAFARDRWLSEEEKMGKRSETEERIDYLNPTLAFLIGDEKRRTERNSDHKTAPVAKRSLAELIENLDKTCGGMEGQPGGYLYKPDPTPALTAFGIKAIEPLTDCMENDNRFTRVVSFARDFFRPRQLVPVSDVARTAINAILKTQLVRGSLDTPEEKHAAAEKVRAYCSKYGAAATEDRWYQILANDAESEEHWLDAACHIVVNSNADEPDSAEQLDSYVSARQTAADIATGNSRHLAGEKLRAKHNPSVSQLLYRRALQLLKSKNQFSQANGMLFVFAIARWDGKQGIVTLKEFSRMIMDGSIGDEQSASAINEQFSNGQEPWMTPLGQLCETRMALGDGTAIADYAKAIETLTPDAVHTAEPFALLWRHYDIPEVKAIAEQLFNGHGSQWNTKSKADPRALQPELWNTAMLAIPPYRNQVIRLLRSDMPVGKVDVSSKGDVMTESGCPQLSGHGYNIHESGCSFAYYSSEGKLPFQPAGKAIYRLKDSVAEKLSSINGFPEFRLHWNVAERDAAVNKSIATLQQYGPAISRALSGYVSDPMEEGTFARAKFSFPQLKQPATAEQVAKGDALFSIAEAGNKHVVRLKTLPVPGQTLVGKDKHAKQEDVCDLEIWQAEEIATPQGTKRYYGVIGEHFMGKMAAEDVNLFQE